ncbi:MAG: peptidylprolyl isomerase [Cyanothece sp. SIO1E1]|nr:peptidylprolyl isomerase [Cyanothece sp. SIO1E1]
MRLNIQRWFVLFLVIGALTVAGCTPKDAVSSAPVDSPVAEAPAAPVEDESPNLSSELPRLAGEATVEVIVKGAPITIQVDGTNAPLTAGNFVDLVQRGVYDGLVFHRVVKEPQPFVAQGGDPQSKDPNIPVQQLGTGGFVDPETSQPRNIPLEIKPEGAEVPIYSQTFKDARIAALPELKHTRGAVAMARSQLPDSASSQFYIALADLDFLDGSYAVFGYVTQGMDVVDDIQQGDRIDTATIIEGAENLTVGG